MKLLDYLVLRPGRMVEFQPPQNTFGLISWALLLYLNFRIGWHVWFFTAATASAFLLNIVQKKWRRVAGLPTGLEKWQQVGSPVEVGGKTGKRSPLPNPSSWVAPAQDGQTHQIQEIHASTSARPSATRSRCRTDSGASSRSATPPPRRRFGRATRSACGGQRTTS